MECLLEEIRMNIEPILSQFPISGPSENIEKPYGFLMSSGCPKMEHLHKIGVVQDFQRFCYVN